MIVCANCGIENPLGRVFCGQCGNKLDTSNIRHDSMAGTRKPNPLIYVWRPVLGLLLAVVLFTFAMSLIPPSADNVRAGKKDDAQKLIESLETLMATPIEQTRGVTLTDLEINAYLYHIKRKALGVDKFSAASHNEWIRFRVHDRMFRFELGPIKIAPRVYYTFDCIPVSGKLRLRQVSKGRLKLGGFLRNGPTRKYLKILTQEADWEIFSSLSEIEAQNGQVHLVMDR
ncbi:MAG: hypothetical protein ACI9X0_002699 [Kiritimatiellia bacterium]|jgi:hypothetical protein